MTATVINFPFLAVPVERTARAIYTDMCARRTGFNNGQIPHSVADGVRCSGSNKAVVVKARKLLIARGLVERTRDGDGEGPALWRVLSLQRTGSNT